MPSSRISVHFKRTTCFILKRCKYSCFSKKKKHIARIFFEPSENHQKGCEKSGEKLGITIGQKQQKA